MKIETLKERIVNTTLKIEKINGTLERHKNQLAKKAKVLTDNGINLTNYDKFDRNIISHEDYYDLCDYEYKLEDITSNEKKLREANTTLESLQQQLNKQLETDSEVNDLVPEVLNIFLENWKQKCYKFYVDLANEYMVLIYKSYKDFEVTKEELEQLKEERYNRIKHDYEFIPKYTFEQIEKILNNLITEYEKENVQRHIRNRYIKKFETSHFASDMIVVNNIIDHQQIDENRLNKILDDEVKIKKEMFIKRIKEVIGEIKDLTGLNTGANGEINGIAKGIKCNAKVETITAGGYNIQCYHFRVLVNVVR